MNIKCENGTETDMTPVCCFCVSCAIVVIAAATTTSTIRLSTSSALLLLLSTNIAGVSDAGVVGDVAIERAQHQVGEA